MFNSHGIACKRLAENFDKVAFRHMGCQCCSSFQAHQGALMAAVRNAPLAHSQSTAAWSQVQMCKKGSDWLQVGESPLFLS